jgi:hypothetical protein
VSKLQKLDPLPPEPDDLAPGPFPHDFDEPDEIKPAPPMPDEPNLRDLVADELTKALDEIKLPAEQKAKLKDDLVGVINARVNIPFIGEAIEAAIIRFLLGAIERVVLSRAQAEAEKLIAKIRG